MGRIPGVGSGKNVPPTDMPSHIKTDGSSPRPQSRSPSTAAVGRPSSFSRPLLPLLPLRLLRRLVGLDRSGRCLDRNRPGPWVVSYRSDHADHNRQAETPDIEVKGLCVWYELKVRDAGFSKKGRRNHANSNKRVIAVTHSRRQKAQTAISELRWLFMKAKSVPFAWHRCY